MPSTVEASCRQVSGGSSDEGEELQETENTQVLPQNRDGYCSDSSSGTSDCSASTSGASSATSTPEHSAPTQIAEVEVEFENNIETNLNENSVFPKWFKFKRKVLVRFNNFPKHLHVYLIMCVKFVLSTLLILATVQFSFPESSHRVVPQRFFHAHSLVKDYYSGDLQQLAERLHFSDLAFVMYYAPWDRDSQQARSQFIATARLLQDQVLFAAINCWQPDSSCRLNHKVSSFPALVLHVNTGVSKGAGTVLKENRALSYTGPLLADHMTRFVSAALRPFRHVGDRKQLAQLQLTHSAVVLTFIEFDPETGSGPLSDSTVLAEEQLSLLYRAALHWLEYDKRTEVVWAVITSSELAHQLGLATKDSASSLSAGRLPPIRMLMADVNYVFNNSLPSWREPRPLLEWVMNHLAGSAGWLEVTGSRSAVLNTVLHRGPALIVFAPDFPHRDASDIFEVVRGLWQLYSTCPPEGVSPHQTRAGRMAAFLLESGERHTSDRTIQRALCLKRSSAGLVEPLPPTSWSGVGPGDADEELGECPALPVAESADHCADSYLTCHRFMPFFAKPGSGGVTELVWSLVGGACQSLFGYSLPASSHYPPPCHAPSGDRSSSPILNGSTGARTCKNEPRAYRPLLSSSVRDDRVAALLWWRDQDRCRRLEQEGDDTPQLPRGEGPASFKHDVAGLVCDSNRTVQFGVLDSRLHGDLARRWGVSLQTQDQKALGWSSGAVLLDLASEALHVLPGPVTGPALAALLYNFTNGGLSRSELSRPIASQYLNDYVEPHLSSGEYNPDLEDVRGGVIRTLHKIAETSSTTTQRSDAAPNTTPADTRHLSPGEAVSNGEGVGVTKKGVDVRTDCEEHLQAATPSVSADGERGNGDGDDAPAEEMIFMTDLTADTYHSVTHEPGQTVLVLHYSRSCAPCTAASHTVLAVASLLAEAAALLPLQNGSSAATPAVRFARIDVSANTLPWHLNFPTLPLLMFYPPYSKSNTLVFDPRVPLTTSNLLRFLASSLGPRHRLSMALYGCSPSCAAALSSRLPAALSRTRGDLALAVNRGRRLTALNARLKLGASGGREDATTVDSTSDDRLPGADAAGTKLPPQHLADPGRNGGLGGSDFTNDDLADILDLDTWLVDGTDDDSPGTGYPVTDDSQRPRLFVLQVARQGVARQVATMRARYLFLTRLQDALKQLPPDIGSVKNDGGGRTDPQLRFILRTFLASSSLYS